MRLGFQEPDPCQRVFTSSRTFTAQKDLGDCRGVQVTVTREGRSTVSQEMADREAYRAAKCEAEAELRNILRGDTSNILPGYGNYNPCAKPLPKLEPYGSLNFSYGAVTPGGQMITLVFSNPPDLVPIGPHVRSTGALVYDQLWPNTASLEMEFPNGGSTVTVTNEGDQGHESSDPVSIFVNIAPV